MRGTQLHLFGNDDHDKTHGRRQSIILPLDTMILMSVVIVLLFILSFSLGVEKGRKIAYKNIEHERQVLIAQHDTPPETEIDSLINETPAPRPVALPAVIQHPNVIKMALLPAPQAAPAQPAKKTTSQLPVSINQNSNESKKYTIQLASYTSKEPAQVEAKKLEQTGYQVQLAQKGKFIVILVGEYHNENDAKNSMQSLKKRYKDCILKKL
jgi:cell division septation protein DedD